MDRKEEAAGSDSDEYDDFGRKKKKFRAGKKYVTCVVLGRTVCRCWPQHM